METNNKKNIISNLIKWIVIIAVLVAVYFWKKDDIVGAIREIKQFSPLVIALCFAMSLLYFVAEGRIIHNMTMYEVRQMTWWESFKCGLFCAFFKFATLGSLSGIAEVYYITKHKIDVGRASGITLVQYTYQKLGITLVGIISFVILYIIGVPTVREYIGWGILGSSISLFIVLVLLVLSVSIKLADILAILVDKVFKLIKQEEKSKELIDKIYTFHEAGHYFFEHKTLCLRVTLLNMVKVCCWYSVAGIVIAASHGAVEYAVSTALMAVVNMIGSVMVAPAGVGTIEFVLSLVISPIYGSLATATVAILYRFFSLVVPFVIGAFIVVADKRHVTKRVDG